MIEAAMIWNEPNNKSHWDPEIDPDWSIFADMAIKAAKAIRAANPEVKRVLGGISPIDPFCIERMKDHGVLDHIDVIALHGFPLDWNLWPINEWPQRIAEIEAVIPGMEIWVTEVGVGSFGAEEVQQFGVNRTAKLLLGRVPRVFWYSLFDLPRTWEATTRHKEAEGSSYYRHFYMGLIKEDGTPKLALDDFRKYAPDMGIMQWFHWHDHRLDDAVRWMKDLGVTHLRTGLSWWDSYRDGWEDWFDRQMEALEPISTRPSPFASRPIISASQPHHTSPPRDPADVRRFLRTDDRALRAALLNEGGRRMSLHDPKRTDINVAIVGVGNCASSLVQGIAHYSNGGANEQIGLSHWDLGGYRPKDLKVVAAWDIDQRKVGRDVAEAIFAPPNCTVDLLRSCGRDRHARADGQGARRNRRAHGRTSRTSGPSCSPTASANRPRMKSSKCCATPRPT